MASTLNADRTAIAATRVPVSRRRLLAPGVGFVAFVISVVGAGTPSYWGDEAASVLAASRSIPQLFQLFGRVDAVHGAYYLFLHFWTGIVGTSEALVRLPSAVAIGIAAAGTVCLGRQLFGSRLGLVAGLIFAIIPQVTRMGVEARSYAFAMAAAVWLVFWFVTLLRRQEERRRVWILYGLAAGAALYLFLYLGLLVVVQAVAVIVFPSGRLVVRRWLQSILVATVFAAPILIAGFVQKGQIGFLARRDYATAKSVFVGQWFSSPTFAVLAWSLIVVAVIAALGPSRRRFLPGASVILVWFAAPTALLLAVNTWISPAYNLRYLAFCTPAVAILLGLGLDQLVSRARDRRWRNAILVAGIAALVIAAAPRYLAQRGPFAKDGGSDLRQTADVVAAHANQGGAIIFDESVKPSRKPRLALDLYPQSFTTVTDVALVTHNADRPVLWDKVAPADSLSSDIVRFDIVWVVESGSHQQDVEAMQDLGYRIEQTLPVHRTTVYELTRE